MDDIHRHFKHSDAWLLLALFVNQREGPSTLDRLIATADGINHAIPTAKQLDGGLNRLLNAGLLRAEQAAFAVTETCLESLRQIEGHGSLHKKLTEVEEFLFGLPTPNTVPRTITISEEMVRDAYEAYLRRLRRR